MTQWLCSLGLLAGDNEDGKGRTERSEDNEGDDVEGGSGSGGIYNVAMARSEMFIISC